MEDTVKLNPLLSRLVADALLDNPVEHK